jgi:predicted nucleotidyltransferase
MNRQQLKKKFERDVQKAVEKLRHYDPEKIILYGSVARGDFNEDSDIDLLIIKQGVDRIKPHIRIYQALHALEGEVFRVEPRVYSPQEIDSVPKNNFFLQEALETGQVIYEKRS